jgi:hypothetical protein
MAGLRHPHGLCGLHLATGLSSARRTDVGVVAPSSVPVLHARSGPSCPHLAAAARVLPLFLAGVGATAVVLGEVRLRTGSIWPCVVMHTVGGAVVNTLILGGDLRFAGHGDALLSPAPNSIASVALLGLLGVLLLRHAKAGARTSRVPDTAAGGVDRRERGIGSRAQEWPARRWPEAPAMPRPPCVATQDAAAVRR